MMNADDLSRFMQCNGSRLMTPTRPAKTGPQSTIALNEAARFVAAEVGRGRLGNGDVRDPLDLVDRKTPNGIYITREMADYIDPFIDIQFWRHDIDGYDVARKQETEAVTGMIDRICFSKTGTLYVDRLEYGWSIVEPDMNWTLLFHAIHFCAFNNIQPVNIVLSVYQPRPMHHAGKHREWEITYPELLAYSHQLSNALANPTNTITTGPNCGKCPALTTCPAARKADLNSIEVSERAFDDSVTNDELAIHLDEITRAQQQLKASEDALTELARHRIRNGQVIENYGLESSWTNKRWDDHVTPDLMKLITGVDLSKPGLITPTQAKKLGVHEAVIDTFARRHETGVKLVRESADKRAKRLLKK